MFFIWNLNLQITLLTTLYSFMANQVIGTGVRNNHHRPPHVGAQVHEHHTEEASRLRITNTHHPNHPAGYAKPRHHSSGNSAPVFNYAQALRHYQDPQQTRYRQQQIVDFNAHRIRTSVPRTRRSDNGVDEVQLFRPENVTATTTTLDLTSQPYHPIRYYKAVRSPHGFRMATGTMGLMKRQLQLDALNALVGQHPQMQLKGLKRLLETNHNNNKEVGNNLSRLQSQLDALSQVQAQDALAKAQYAAQVHVQAQHDAILKAQQDALPPFLRQNSRYVYSIDAGQQDSSTMVNMAPPMPFRHSSKSARLIHSNVEAIQFPETHQEYELKPVRPKLVGMHTETPEDKEDVAAAAAAAAAPYAFGYRIKDYKMGNDFGHEEKRDGKTTTGHYHVLLPDGRLQKVDYYVDPTGYHAKVTYEPAVVNHHGGAGQLHHRG